MKRYTCALIGALCTINLFAQTITLDSTFGTNGKTVFSVAAGARCQFCLPQPDGSSILVCEAASESFFIASDIIMLAKLNPQGNLDSSFHQNGIRRIDLTDSLLFFEIRSAVQLPSGDIIVGCSMSRVGQGGSSHLLYKFDAGGNPDPDFGVDGVVELSFPDASHFMYELLTLPDGHILILSSNFHDTSSDQYVLRLKPDGSVDGSFADNGYYYFAGGVIPSAFYPGLDNMIYVIGQLVIPNGPNSFDNVGFLKRFDLNMQEDLTFFNHFEDSGFFGSFYFPTAVGFQPDNKILVSGGNHLMTRFNYDGTPDPAFHKDGKAENSLDPSPSAQRIVVTPKGKIIFDKRAFSFVNLNSNGTLYYGFDYDGILDVYPAASQSEGNVTGCPYFNVQSDGKILVAGYFENKVYVARYKE